MKLPIWWLKNVMPYSTATCRRPKICPTRPTVNGMVHSHRNPITAANATTEAWVTGSATKAQIATARAM